MWVGLIRLTGMTLAFPSSFADSTFVTSGFAMIAFLVAIRLLISDFFSIDIAYSLVLISFGRFGIEHSSCQTEADAWNL
jgi:hypothetical protein